MEPRASFVATFHLIRHEITLVLGYKVHCIGAALPVVNQRLGAAVFQMAGQQVCIYCALYHAPLLAGV